MELPLYINVCAVMAACTQRLLYHFIRFLLVIYPLQLAYVSDWQVKTAIKQSGYFFFNCNTNIAKSEQVCIFLRLNFKRLDLLRSYNVNYPLRKTGKHGDTTLILQRYLFAQDLTICMDVKANPGPEKQDEIVSRSALVQISCHK